MESTSAPSASGRSSTDDPVADLSIALADDLCQVLGRPVSPPDLLPRRDGAAAPVVGLLSLVEPRLRQTAARLTAEWAAADTATRQDAAAMAGPVGFDFPGLRVAGQRLVDGLRLAPVPAGTAAVEALATLVSTAAALVGGVREVVTYQPGEGADGLRRVPGWVARLGLLTRGGQLGDPAAARDDLGAWVVAAHELVSSVYVPEAAAGSLWRTTVSTVRTLAQAALKDVDQLVSGDLDRRSSKSFGELVDLSLCVELPGQSDSAGAVLQVVRLPRQVDGRVLPGAVLLAAAG